MNTPILCTSCRRQVMQSSTGTLMHTRPTAQGHEVCPGSTPKARPDRTVAR